MIVEAIYKYICVLRSITSFTILLFWLLFNEPLCHRMACLLRRPVDVLSDSVELSRKQNHLVKATGFSLLLLLLLLYKIRFVTDTSAFEIFIGLPPPFLCYP